MHRIRMWVLFCLAIGLAFASDAAAQSLSAMVSIPAARQFGLEKVWQTQVDMDRTRGRLAGIAQHVSSTRVHTVFEFQYRGHMYRFSEWELDAFGQKIGVDEAKKKAEDKREQFQLDAQVTGEKFVKPEIVRQVIPEVNLYCSSERGSVHAIDGETGRTRWSVTVGNPQYTTLAPAANDNYVAVVSGLMLYVLKASDGTLAFERRLSGAPGSGPAVSSELIYVPMISGSVETYQLEKPRHPVQIQRSHGAVLVQPIASARSVAWTTDKGIIYSANGEKYGLRFRMAMPDASSVAPAFLSPDYLIGVSVDGHMYCMHEALGTQLWRVSTGESVNQRPVGVNGTAYLFTDSGGLFAIDGETGREKWWTSGVKGYLSATNERLYCLDLSGNIIVLDSRSGSRLGTIPAQNLDVRYHNTLTDRIFLGTPGGTLMMLRETARTWPLVHANRETEKQKPVEVKQMPAGGDGLNPMPKDPFNADDPFAAPQPKPAPMPADPFGGAADPFADPKPMPMPKPAAPADPFDPFK